MAIAANRATTIDGVPIAFTPEFTGQASTLPQSIAFMNKSRTPECPETLAEIVPLLTQFHLPIASERSETFEGR